MKLALTIAVCSILAGQFATAALAQTKPQPVKAPGAKPAQTTKSEPTVDQILDKYVQALGGREALEKISSRTIKATFEVESIGLQGEIEIFAKAPNKLLTIQNIPGIGLVQDGYDGQIAWSENPMMGVREKSGTELAIASLLSDFHAPLRTKQRYSKLEFKGKEKVGEHETWVILATPAEGHPMKIYFDAQTGLQTRLDMDLDTPQGKLSIQTTMGDYREVDGVKLPFITRQESAMGQAIIKLTEVKSNVAIDDAKFKKPTGQ